MNGKWTGGIPVELSPGGTLCVLRSDGQWVPLSSLPGVIGGPFDATCFYAGIPTASALIMRVPIARSVAFPADFGGSYGVASAAATASTAFDIQKNGASVGTATFASSATTATFVSASHNPVSVVAGDVIAIIAPATPDATLADPGFVLAGTR